MTRALTDPARAGALAAGLVVATAAWVVAGEVAPEGYSHVGRSLSQLQRTGTSTRPLMTTGLAVLGAGLLLAAPVVGRALRSTAASVLVRVAGAATLVGAAFPLAVDKGLPQDLPHNAAAAVGYAAVSLLPLLGARRLAGGAARASGAVGAVTLTCMVLTVPLHDVTGALQRAGLTLGLAWLTAVAVAQARSSSTERRSAACSDSGVSTPR